MFFYSFLSFLREIRETRYKFNKQITNKMAITKEQKKIIVKNLADKFSKSKIAVFTGFQRLKVSESEELRNKLREENIDYRVTKKTLIKTGLGKSDLKNVELPKLEGSVATAFGYDDEATAAKLINDFSKTNKNLVVLGGLMNGQFVSASKIKILAKLPNREQMLAQTVSAIQAPISGFANVLSGNIRNLVGVLTNIAEGKK